MSDEHATIVPTPPVAPETVTYFAISILSSRTFWLNAAAFLITALSATDVVPIIPVRFLPFSTAIVSMLNIGLRLGTVRPAALILPGNVKPIDVPKIAPPAPPVVSD
jgi:hypothetical protein